MKTKAGAAVLSRRRAAAASASRSAPDSATDPRTALVFSPECAPRWGRSSHERTLNLPHELTFQASSTPIAGGSASAQARRLSARLRGCAQAAVRVHELVFGPADLCRSRCAASAWAARRPHRRQGTRQGARAQPHQAPHERGPAPPRRACCRRASISSSIPAATCSPWNLRNLRRRLCVFLNRPGRRPRARLRRPRPRLGPGKHPHHDPHSACTHRVLSPLAFAGAARGEQRPVQVHSYVL